MVNTGSNKTVIRIGLLRRLGNLRSRTEPINLSPMITASLGTWMCSRMGKTESAN